MSWYDIYINEIALKKDVNSYIKYKINHKKKLIKMIEKYANNGKIVECGCGTAIIATYLASLHYSVDAIDIDDKIIELARFVSNGFDSKNKAQIKKGDIFNYNTNVKYDVAFSNGVLEHFDDDDVISIINNELKIANTVIIGIPTKFFDDSEALYGNERFLELSYWRNVISYTDGYIVEECSYHYMANIEKILNFKKYFRPKPFRVFVVKKSN